MQCMIEKNAYAREMYRLRICIRVHLYNVVNTRHRYVVVETVWSCDCMMSEFTDFERKQVVGTLIGGDSLSKVAD